ncbi:MAG: purine/pyrimidine permease [Alistipes sp.]|nr:purine/pyrimidine permease [Alistipes sp.]
MKLKYELNDRPRIVPMLMYGLQWLLIAIPVVLTSTFVAPEGETVMFTRKLFGIMGAGMILQALFGHRLPLISGPAAALLMGILAATLQGYGSAAIYTSIFIGGAVIALAALCGITERVGHLFTPRIVIVILMLIAFTIARPILGLIFSDSEHQLLAFCFSTICVLLMAAANNLLRGTWKTTVVTIALIFGSLIYYAITGFPSAIAADTHSSPLFVFTPEFDFGLILSFLFCYIAFFINEVGSIQSLGTMIGADAMKSRNRRGMGMVGILNMLAGSMGTIGPIDYSLSPGVVASTSCASRYTVIPAGIAMIAIAFWPQAVGVLMTIPATVMGTILLFLMGTQLAAGFEMTHSTRSVTSFRHGLIIGIPIMFDVILSFAPAEAIAQIPALIRPIAGNGFVMGVIIVLILEHIILKDGQEVRPTKER